VSERLVPVAIFFLLWFSSAAARDLPVASFKTVSGSVTLISANGRSAAEAGMRLHQNDTVVTGPDGSAGIIFKDDTRLSLGPNTTIVIDSYVFDPGQGRFSMVTRIVRGTAAYISGRLGALAPEAVEFKTPTASLTIRGTHFLARVIER
jgi:hypothetical protein